MFPFLAPIRQANHVESQGTTRYVEITFMAESPYVSRVNSATNSLSLRNQEDASSIKSRSNEGLNVNSSGSRPTSRAKSKNSVSSQPTSARSEKSSPVPLKDTPPAPSRHKNKGLEMSSAMMELFGGGGGSAFGPSSAFETIPASSNEQKSFHRKNMLDREFEKSSAHSTINSNLPGKSESAYKPIENHDFAYQRALKKARGRDLSKPDSEWFEGFEKLDVSNIELPPDPNCPATKFLRQLDSEKATSSSSLKSATFESLPGPDIGAGVEDEEEEEEEVVLIDSPTECGQQPEEDGVDGGSSLPVEKHKIGNANGGEEDDERGGAEKRRKESKDGERMDADDEGTIGGGDRNGEQKGGSAGGSGMVLLIRNAQIINDDAIFAADVLIEDGVISNVGPNLEAPSGAEIIDASGKMVLPAGIDVHTQISHPDSADDLITGCKSAIAGGTATIVEVVTPKSGESPSAAFKRVKGQLDKALCNVSLSVSLSNWNESTKSEMEKLVAEGVNSFVVDSVDSDDKLFQLLDHSRKLGSYIRIVPENKNIISILERKMLSLGVNGPEGFPQSRPEELESDRVNNICALSSLANCPVSIVSVSSGESLQSIEKARSNGTLAHAEIASAAVAADGQGLLNRDLKVAAAHLTDVPLRKHAADRLISALSSSPLVVCTSGHKPINSNARLVSKDFPSMPKGSTGAEERMAVVWEKAVRSGRIDPMRFVAVTSSNAAKVFNMYPKKGRIAVGADADLVIWDASGKRTLSAAQSQSSVDVSLFDGLTVHSTIFATIVGGKIAFQDGSVKEASGGYLPLSPNSPYLFSMVSQRDKFGNIEKVERDAGSASTAKTTQNGSQSISKGPNDFDRDRNRRLLMGSKINFGDNNSSRNEKSSGGRSTGFW